MLSSIVLLQPPQLGGQARAARRFDIESRELLEQVPTQQPLVRVFVLQRRIDFGQGSGRASIAAGRGRQTFVERARPRWRALSRRRIGAFTGGYSASGQ